jgi:hypothetical protein
MHAKDGLEKLPPSAAVRFNVDRQIADNMELGLTRVIL